MEPIFTGERLAILGVTSPIETADGRVNLTVTFENIGTVPFTASADDSESHGKWLYEEARKGTFGEIAPWERPLPTLQDLQEELDKIWPDIVLGVADEDTVELARNLRKQIKAMSE